MKKLCYVLVSMLLGLLFAEGLHRCWLMLQGTPYSAEATANELRRLADPSGSFVPDGSIGAEASGRIRRELPVLHPYSGSESAPDTGGVLAAFREGFEPNEYVVVVVGGSVAASWVTGSGGFLSELLDLDPRLAGRSVRVLNYAHASYKQPQQLMRIAYLFSLGYRPDAVINMDGFNEVAFSLQNLAANTHPVYPPVPVWGLILRTVRVDDDSSLERTARLWTLREEAHDTAERAFGLGLQYSSLLGTLTRARMAGIDRERAELYGDALRATSMARRGRREVTAFERQLRGPDFDHERSAVLAAGARNWLESSISLHAMCVARGIYYLHVLQPTLHDAGAKPFSHEELGLGEAPDGWEEGARDGYRLLRAHVPELEAQDLRFYDASRIFESIAETLYVDHCHLNAEGERLLTAAVATAFLDRLPPR